jgi:hypothetical protein
MKCALSLGILPVTLAVLLTASAGVHAESPAYKASPSRPPKDAILLFDGKDTSKWEKRGSKDPITWKLEDGAITAGGGDIETVERFTDFDLHVEFNVPNKPDAHSQEKGNSGVYLQGLYEIQVLDSFNNETYADGMCGAIYGQKPPLINACKPPEQWQTYDIAYRAPRFDASGDRTEKARVTVYHNGMLIHDNDEIEGPTRASGQYDPKQPNPVMLQDHGNPVKYRNIWIVPMKP